MSTQTQVSGLLALMVSAVACAAAITAFMVYQYGPSGSYSVKSALLDPELVPVLSFNDTNTKTGGQTRFVFDKITFTYFDVADQRMRQQPITNQQYQDFYSSIDAESSMVEAPEEIVNLFNRGNPARLTIYIRTESNARWQEETKVFQEVQFANEGNFYRIQLREEENPQGDWAYYHHPNVKNEILKLFIPKQ